MGGSSNRNSQTTQQNSIQQQSQRTTSAATVAGDAAIPGLTDAFNRAVQVGGYQGNFIAPNQNWTGNTTAVAGAPVANPNNAPNYTGPIRAGPNDGQIEGAQNLIDFGRQQVAPTQAFVNSGQTFAQNVVDGQYLNPDSNDALQRYIASLRTGAGISNSQAINQARDMSVEGGAYGGTGYGQNMALMQGEQTRGLEDAISRILYTNYGDEMARIERMPGMFGELSTLGTLPSQYMTAGGNQQNALDQISIDNTRSSYEAEARNTQAAWENQEWLRQEEMIRQQQILDNERGAFQGNAANEQDALNNAMFRHQAQIDGIYDPYRAYFSALGNAPVTTTVDSSGITNASGTGTGITPGGSPWASLAGSALTAFGSYYANRPAGTTGTTNNIQNARQG